MSCNSVQATKFLGKALNIKGQGSHQSSATAGYERSGAGNMDTEFVQTGQTFAEDGGAYCPVERRRRGAGGLAASMAVLLGGAGFLTYSMLATPTRMDESVQPEARVVIPITATSEILPETVATPAVEAAPAEIKLSIEEALAESRAARANSASSGAHAKTAFEPSLKPTSTLSLLPDLNQDGIITPKLKPELAAIDGDVYQTGLSPRVKPSSAGQHATAQITAPRPMRLGGAFLASVDDAPPPFFFESDIRPLEVFHTAAPITLAADIDRQIGEMRIRITRGETFVDALKRAGIRAADRNDAAYAFGKHYNLRRLLPGQEFDLTLGWPNQTLFQLAANGAEPEARLMGLEFRVDAEKRIVMRRDNAGALAAETSEVALTTRTMAIAGRINGSLYVSAKTQGAPDSVIAGLANAFAYDVDFQRDIFGGDEFEAIFEVNYDDQGKLVSAGDIVFARLKWRGRKKEKGYYRFIGDNERPDFYDAAGQSAKRLLMKTPIDGARLSSGFGSRKHPILGYRRAHKGVDFAARRGTPVYAAGDGVIERANRYGSFGNYVRIKHANGYKTAYAHLKGFRRGIRAGKRVRQGDVIAYVGTTGRSTGPHLHYEVHKNGTAVNPQRLRIATGKKLKGAELARFKAARDRIDTMRLPQDEGTGLLAKDDVRGNSL